MPGEDLTKPLKVDELAERANVAAPKSSAACGRNYRAPMALDVGFGTQSRFTLVFHTLTGVTRSHFRRAQDARA